jgi:hypothetical protein
VIGRFSSVVVRHAQFGFDKFRLLGLGFREHHRAGCLYIKGELVTCSGILLEALHLRAICMPGFFVMALIKISLAEG